MLVCGCDPGITGALAFIDCQTWEIVRVVDMPVYSVTTRNKTRNYVDANKLAAIREWRFTVTVCLEEVASRPTDSRVAAFSLGRSLGVLQGFVAASELPCVSVPPSVWKADLALSSDKDLSRAMASALFPKSAHLFARKKDHNRAEAALLAYYVCKGAAA